MHLYFRGRDEVTVCGRKIKGGAVLGDWYYGHPHRTCQECERVVEAG